ncbi:N-acetylmuramoyl-L-alanine amidase [Candidatus Puniceispirillum sp.]|jgi:N-acetylmuramoyl-L-alanine amidase|uniref:N-acetylmuramoyl-L-alanine amidase n=1 Tax=Candidatus Puniceispirillum sp. TaxID=2026719 RepID=UPI002FCE2444
MLRFDLLSCSLHLILLPVRLMFGATLRASMGCLCYVLPVLLSFLVTIFAGVGLVASPAQAANNNITAIRLGDVSIDGIKGLRLVIETKNPAKASMLLLEQPFRLVVDLEQTDWQASNLPRIGKLTKAPAKSYRFGNPKPDTGRLVIELSAPAAPRRIFRLPPSAGGHRLVIDMIDNGTTAFTLAARALAARPNVEVEAIEKEASSANGADTVPVTRTVMVPKAKPKTDPQQAQGERSISMAVPKTPPKKWVVFIDAGHGGKDPGAIGLAGTKEKDITLAASHELARQLRATGRVIPILARKDDRYLKLRERIRLARAKKSDLFISLHADSAANKSAHGLSVFTLSETASDKEAAALARNENKADLIGGPDLGVEDPETASELLRMFQRESMNQSTYFASDILSQIRDLRGGDRRGHRFAGFAVLKAPDMPSVLIEMGFLSNRKDEVNLRSQAYRRLLCQRITKAVISYLQKYGPA